MLKVRNLDSEAAVLSRVYQLILSWPDSEESKTADTLDLRGEQEPAVSETAEVSNESEPTSK
jgi:hypothetical protein